MKEIKFKKIDFDFDRFVDAIADFIEETFGSDSPAETMRYFYSFDQVLETENSDKQGTREDFFKKMIETDEKRKNGEITEEECHLKILELNVCEAERQNEFDRQCRKEKVPVTFTDKDPDEWGMEDFKDAILKSGKTIFFPFSSGLDDEGYVSLASGASVQLGNADGVDSEGDGDEGDGDEAEAENENLSIGMTDCFGFLINLVAGKFIFNSAIAWGDQASSIEPADHPKIDPELKKFIKSFKMKINKV